MDLDHFKNINDALGHEVGDQLLRAVARRISNVAGPDARSARLGGDEFVILLEAGPETSQDIDQWAQATAQRVMDKLGPPVFVGDRALSIGASVGIAAYPVGSESELDIVRHADMALYRAKIDKSFVAELGTGAENPPVESIIAIGQHMHLDVVAEGVETESQCNILRVLSCT